jgi:hypothetical protein
MSLTQKLNSEVKELLGLTDTALKTQNAEVTLRIRTRLEAFIIDLYGKESVFHRNFCRIGKWDSVVNIQEIRGVLMAIKDNIQNNPKFSLPENSIGKANPNQSTTNFLSYLILKEFYENSQYNWEAVRNLILGNSDFFEFSEGESAAIFEKFKERGIIASIGIGHAHVITEEGKKLFKRLSSQWHPSSNMVESPVAIKNTNDFTWDVFLCHSSKDKAMIYQIATDLKARDISYWLDAEQINPGDNIFNKITEGLIGSKTIVPCFSENQLASGWRRHEYQSILGQMLSNLSIQRIAPLALNDFGSENVPLFLSHYRYERYFVKKEYENFLSFLEAAKYSVTPIT